VSLLDLGVLYLCVGLACAVAVYRASPPGGSRAASAALAVPLWPLWAPIVLTSARGAPGAAGAPRVAAEATPVSEAAARIQAALREATESCAGTALAALLPREVADRISSEVARAAGRHAELTDLLRREGGGRAAAEARVRALAEPGASPRALATARLHLDNVRRIAALRDRDARALDELSDLVGALRAQLALARFAGTQAEGTSGIVSEMWARVEGLGAALAEDEGDDGSPPPVTGAADAAEVA
jgi:hypothetical protein